ncbi:MAG: 5-formyltetrahydrofolate cyclo-ligase [Halobacteriota archaeon]
MLATVRDKQSYRTAVWDRLEAEGVARFPFPPHGRIPNFAGARAAADRVAALCDWGDVEVLKSNPDAPQRPLRAKALQDGITVVMAEPRLRSSRPFLVLDPARIDDAEDAATIGGASEHGRPVEPSAVPTVDMVLVGSVAVDEAGRRIGKGEGYSDLEFAMLLEYGRLARDVPVVTTVHEHQLYTDPLPSDPLDVPVDTVVTPERVVRAQSRPSRPEGIDWSHLEEGRLDEMPALRSLRESPPADGAESRNE